MVMINERLRQLQSCNAATLRKAGAKQKIITIRGKPTPKERPRKGAGGKFYTPTKTKQYENKVGWSAYQAGYKNKIKKGEKCKVVIRAYFLKKQVGDSDNLIKSCLDGMNKIVYPDDRCVREICFRSFEGQKEEKVEIEVFPIIQEK